MDWGWGTFLVAEEYCGISLAAALVEGKFPFEAVRFGSRGSFGRKIGQGRNFLRTVRCCYEEEGFEVYFG